MRKRVLSMTCAVMLVFGMLCVPTAEVQAAEEVGAVIDGSVLTMEDSSQGELLNQTRGVYLQSGNSMINDAGTGRISAGGNTYATRSAKVKVTVYIQRLVNGTWEAYTSFTATKTGYSVGASKTLTVPKGYYYRVVSRHYANSDTSSSATGGLYV
ncbi:MAG: DUF6147 family protein [Lachnospiraceae bacterium]